jgi:hypothetical protein
MLRVPTSRGERVEEHGYLQECGRPVSEDGLCAFHARRRDGDQDLARSVRMARAGRR